MDLGKYDSRRYSQVLLVHLFCISCLNLVSANCTSQQLNATAEPVFPDWSNFTFLREASCGDASSQEPPLCFYWESNGATFVETADNRTPFFYIDQTFTIYLFAVFVAGPIGPLAFAKPTNCTLSNDNRFLAHLLRIRQPHFY
jgi:hypothetical protein